MTLYIITGPPCVGKSTYAKRYAVEGDIVVDLDRIALSIGYEDCEHHTYPKHIRDTARLMRKSAVAAAIIISRKNDAYVIDSKPGSNARQLYKRNAAVFIDLTAPLAVLTARCAAERPAWVMKTLVTWWDVTDDEATRRHA